MTRQASLVPPLDLLWRRCVIKGDQVTLRARKACATAASRLAQKKVPAVIASKTKEELQVYVLDLLKKLKVRDKRIEGECQVTINAQ
jgi:hypothetical protein